MKPDYSRLELPPAPQDRPYVLLNMVMSIDGKVVVEGSEKGIGSKVDQRLMREIRTNADVILNGATTTRVSGTSPRLGDPGLEEIRRQRGKPAAPIAAILTRSGNLPLEKAFFTAGDFEAIVYCSDAAPRERLDALRLAGRPVVTVAEGHEVDVMLAHMRHELGAAVLVIEGGPTLNAAFFTLDAVDEFFLTLGPVVVAGKDTLTAVEGERAFARNELRRFDLVSAAPNEETSEVYLRYRRDRG